MTGQQWMGAVAYIVSIVFAVWAVVNVDSGAGE